MSLSQAIEEAQWRAGLRHKPSHVHEHEQREAAAEQLDADDFFSRAKSRFEQDYGRHFTDEQIENAAGVVGARWREQGREITFTAGTADSIAAAVGNHLHMDGASYFDPGAPGSSAPSSGGSLSEQLKAHQKERGL